MRPQSKQELQRKPIVEWCKKRIAVSRPQRIQVVRLQLARGRTGVEVSSRLSFVGQRRCLMMDWRSCNRQSKIYNWKFFLGVLAQLVERLNGMAVGRILMCISLAHFGRISLSRARLTQLRCN